MVDGVVTIRPPEPGDSRILVAGRDAEWERWLAPGDPEPHPTSCVVVGGEVVGWVDADAEPDWLPPRGVNIGFNTFAAQRGRGYASRAVQLTLHRLALEGRNDTAVLVIDPENAASLAVASRTRFTLDGDHHGSLRFTRPIPPLAYTDGTVTIRRQHPRDIDADLTAKDHEQIKWLWLPGQRERWEAMSPAQQREHALRGLQSNHDSFGSGPKWTFAVDVGSTHATGYVDCDLANANVPAGEANVSYSTHPDYRAKGIVSAAVRLLFRFLMDHTAAREAHFVIDPANVASLRVAGAVGAVEAERFVDDGGKLRVRYIRRLTR